MRILEGNHERWLWKYANGEMAENEDFEAGTKHELDMVNMDKKMLRKLCRKFQECAYYRYGENIFLVTHGGLSTIPQNLSFVSAEQMIRGVGRYSQSEEIAENFLKTTEKNCYQIHGHRNTKKLPVRVNDRVFNLEGKVEFGGALRCVQVDKEGIHIVEVKNEVLYQ